MTPDLSIYLVTDADACRRAGRSVVGTVVDAVAGGVTAVQLREKDASARDFLALVTAVAGVLPPHVALFVNDRVDVFCAARARGVRVTGVHVGQSDLPVAAVRALVGPDALIGLSASTPAQLAAAAADPAGVAYVGVGALHPTATKADAPEAIGHERFARLCAASRLPVVAIGGVTAADLPALRAAGAAGGAVVSAVCGARDARDAAAGLARAWREGAGGTSAERTPGPGDGPSRRTRTDGATGAGTRGAQTTTTDAPLPTPPRVLAIAGTDPTGGAGLQADLKAIAANGGYGMAVATALVAQNTRGVRSVHLPPVAFLREQLDAVSDDVDIDAVKIGMLGTADVAGAVEEWLGRVRPPLVVLDPVMVATSGDRLLDRDAVDALRRLARRVDLVTPNIPELAILAGEPDADDWAGVLRQAEAVSRELGVRVFAKGGHLGGETAPDALVDANAAGGTVVREFPGERVATRNTHGTGCSLSSALATRLARADADTGATPGAPAAWDAPIAAVKDWLTESLAAADTLRVGGGNGPIHHFAGLWERERRPVTARWWEAVRDVRERIHASAFVRGLGDGTLDRRHYRWYLAQDALYLAGYAELLERAAALAPGAEESAFWAASAVACREEELRLHREELGEVRDAASPVTAAYLGHLRAAANGGHAVLTAALLPCFWVYAEVGAALTAGDGHPYREWVGAYSAAAFQESTRRAIAFTAAAWEAAGPTDRAAAWDAFRASTELEEAFFDAALTLCPPPPPAVPDRTPPASSLRFP